jgi:hypothetical protein
MVGFEALMVCLGDVPHTNRFSPADATMTRPSAEKSAASAAGGWADGALERSSQSTQSQRPQLCRMLLAASIRSDRRARTPTFTRASGTGRG